MQAICRQSAATDMRSQALESDDPSGPSDSDPSSGSSGTPDGGEFQIAKFSLSATPTESPRNLPSRKVYVTIDSRMANDETSEQRAAREQCNDAQ